MFDDQALIDHIDTEQALSVEAGCFVELNQNDPNNIETLGVFKWGEYPASMFVQWTNNEATFYKHDPLTTDMRKSTYNDDTVYFDKRPKADYFNLADCFTDFRPRSGILKAVQPYGKDRAYVDDFLTVRRPRYYIPSVKDEFKYWTSWNTDVSPTANVGLSDANGVIKNAAPFVVYSEPKPANMVTVKIQTSMGEPDRRLFAANKKDPLSDPTKSTLPRLWRIEYLDVHKTWRTIKRFDTFDPQILDPVSGTIDLVYMIVNPKPVEYPNFVLKGYLDATTHLPLIGRFGEAFVIGRSATSIGKVVVWNGTEWEGADDLATAPDAEYAWRLFDYDMNPEEYAVRDFVDPKFYNPTAADGEGDYNNEYSEFVLINGLRIIVEEMVAPFHSFDLIELSPRLFCNLSDHVESYSISKAVSEDSVLPVGGMSVANGTITLSNMDMILNREAKFDHMTRKGSILSGNIRRNSKFILYEIVKNVPEDGLVWDKFIPVQTLYAIEKPTVATGMDEVSVELRDLTFLFEEKRAQNIVLKDASLSKAVATLLDYIGFSNYIFHIGPEGSYPGQTSPLDSIIPYFFVNETMSVAEALQALAIATQCAMFFDEKNNFVVMPREWFNSQPTYTLRGGSARTDLRPNIESINEIETQMIADAEITFTHRDLARERILTYQRSDVNASTTQGESSNVLGYKVNPLWDASKLENNVLGVGVLRTALTSEPPKYDPTAPDGIRNGSFDIGMWAELFPDFSGMIMMNGEIIRFTAKQYSIGGRNVWVTSQNHLNELVGRSSFKQPNGKGQMVYPTGLMRIFVEMSEGDDGSLVLVGHGRGMYGTPIQYHPAEPIEWTKGVTYTHTDTALDTVFGIYTTANYNFAQAEFAKATTTGAVATNYIYNPMHSRNAPTELNPINVKPSDVALFEADRRIMRASALTFAGPASANARQVFKKIKQLPGNQYSLFGARIGIVGNTLSAQEQAPFGAMVLGEYKTDADSAEMVSVIGAGGGLLFGTSRMSPTGASDDGYYLEITALNSSYQVDQTGDTPLVVFSNVNFYKINRGTAVTSGLTGGNVAVPLWETYMDIRVTSGSQMARDRLMTDYNLVYDIAVEVKQKSTTRGLMRTFYIYVNDQIVGVVDDLNTDQGANGGKVYHPRQYDNTEVGVFARGTSTIQVEHLYAVGTDQFNDSPITIDSKVYKRPRSFKVFSPSAIWSTVALTGGPTNNWRYYEEFGSMARECRKIDATFDMFPAFSSKIAKRPIFDKAYSVTHYTDDPYGASMMLWAQSDRSIRLADDATLDIQGLTFADNQPQTLRIDDFLTGKSDGSLAARSYNDGIALRNKLLAARVSGTTEKIELDSLYIQNRDYAEKMFRWLIGFIGVERSFITLTAFGVPHIQKGDIVTIDYDMPARVSKSMVKNDYSPDQPEYVQEMVPFEDNGKRFMVRKITIDRDMDGPTYTLDLVELPNVKIWGAGEF